MQRTMIAPPTKETLGLGTVSNLAPADLPISTAVQTALDAKAPTNADLLTVGEETVERRILSQTGVGISSGTLRLTYFTARKSETTTQVKIYTAGTAAGATPTLCRLGLYSISAGGAGTLVASIASDTTLFAATNTAYTRSWSSSFAKVAGQRYALGVIVVSGASTPTFYGSVGILSAATGILATAPRLTGRTTAQPDRPACVVHGRIVVVERELLLRRDPAVSTIVRAAGASGPSSGPAASSLQAFGAKGDGRSIATATTTSGSATVTAASGTFSAADVGKAVVVNNTLVTTITAAPSSSQITLASTVGISLSGTASLTWGTDDAAAIRAAIAALPASGGELVMAAGPYVTTSTVTVDRPLKLTGRGGSSGDHGLTPPSRIVYLGKTGDALSVSADGCTFEDFAVVCPLIVNPTAGAGIRISSGRYTHLNRLSISGFYDNVVFSQSLYPTIRDCYLLDPVRYGLYLSNATEFDTGDQIIDGCVFALAASNRNPTSAIRWESGGGPKISNCKVNGRAAVPARFANGIDCQVADGGATSDLLVTGCSIENVTATGITVGQLGTTGKFSNIVITGNQFGAGAIPDVIKIAAASSVGFIDAVTITGNVIRHVTNTGVYLKYVTGATVSGNYIFGDFATAGIYANFSTVLDIGPNTINGPAGTNGACVYIDANCSQYSVERQSVSPVHNTLLRDQSAGQANTGARGKVVIDEARAFPTVASTSTYTDLFSLTPTAGNGGVLEVTLTGRTVGGSSPGPFTITARRLVTRPASGAVTLTTVGTDSTAGPAVDYQFDTATTAGELRISARLNAASGATAIYGETSIRYNGPVQFFRRS